MEEPPIVTRFSDKVLLIASDTDHVYTGYYCKIHKSWQVHELYGKITTVNPDYYSGWCEMPEIEEEES
jgi:hypothetical protein